MTDIDAKEVNISVKDWWFQDTLEDIRDIANRIRYRKIYSLNGNYPIRLDVDMIGKRKGLFKNTFYFTISGSEYHVDLLIDKIRYRR